MPDDYPAAVIPGGLPQQGPDLTKLEDFQNQFNQTFESYKVVANVVEDNRAHRNLLVDVNSLQAQGKLRSNETYIAQRIIDTNIARDMPPHVAYLTQSRRLAIFVPENINIKKETLNLEVLETEFMRVMTYTDWINDYVRWVDGAKLHGFDYVAVCYDESMPGSVAVRHVGTGNLGFDIRVRCIQQAPLIYEMHEITTVDLKEMAEDYEFDPKVTAQLMEKLQQPVSSYGQTMSEANRIYQAFFKKDHKVWTGWYSKDLQVFLKKPEVFFNGIYHKVEVMPEPAADAVTLTQETAEEWVPVAETDYPYFVYLNRITENERIADTTGVADSAFYLQEAACSLWSAFVNGCITSSNTMWAPKTPNPEIGVAPKQLSMVVDHGKIWNVPMESFHVPWPDAMLPRALELLRTQNAEDTNQVSFATNNRRDTRKTATEIEAAQSQDQIMSSVEVTLFSSALQRVWTAAWKIIQVAALRSKIVFAPMPQVQGSSTSPVNDTQLIEQDYKIEPAGTVDYINRLERLTTMQEDLPMMVKTPIGPIFLEEYIKAKYPDIAAKLTGPLAQAMVQGQQAAQQLPALAQKLVATQTLLKAAVEDGRGNILPEWQAHAPQIQTALSNPGASTQVSAGAGAGEEQEPAQTNSTPQ